jgi:hypothetical protein
VETLITARKEGDGASARFGWHSGPREIIDDILTEHTGVA